MSDVPCFDPTCPCCSAHTILERQYEDRIKWLEEMCSEHTILERKYEDQFKHLAAQESEDNG